MFLRKTTFNRTIKIFWPFILWVIWFLIRYTLTLSKNKRELLRDLRLRSENAYQATLGLVQAALKFFVAWTEFILPFVMDTFRAVKYLVGSLTVEQKFYAAFFFLASCLTVYVLRQVKQNSKKLSFLIFQLSYVACGPYVFYFFYHLVRPIFRRIALMSLVTAIPLICSLIAFSKKNEKAAEMFLSFFPIWPFLVASLSSLRSDGFTETLCIVLLVWLEFWEGSHLVFQLIASLKLRKNPRTAKLSKLVDREITRVISTFTACSFRSFVSGSFFFFTSNSPRTRLQRLSRFIITNFLAVMGIALVVMLGLFRFILVVQQAVTYCIVFTMAVDTVRVRTKRMKDYYFKRLAFWIILLTIESFGQFPIIGGTLRVARPFLVTIAAFQGDWLVSFGLTVARFLSPKWTLKSVRTQKTGEVRIEIKEKNENDENNVANANIDRMGFNIGGLENKVSNSEVQDDVTTVVSSESDICFPESESKAIST